MEHCLICQLDPDVPELVAGDAIRLTQIVVNLVGNSIKFTEEGEIVVKVRKQAERVEEVCLEITVNDTGIGIPQDKQKAIFEAFTQADGSSTRKYGGTGLGLTISSQLVALMGGRIWVESEPGRGSTFGFTACFGVRSSAQTARIPFDLHGLRLLVVDDNRTNLRMLEDLLANWGAQVVAAQNAKTALAALLRGRNTGTPFRLVLIDAEMPETNGFALARRMREEAGLNGKIVMMLSSAADLADAARCRQLGIQAHVVKPIHRAELRSAIARSLGEKDEQTSAADRPIQSLPKKLGLIQLRILLVEDNLVNRKLAVRLLEKQGHTVITANNGREAIEALDNLKWEVDLILMDVQMPEMDGYQATAAIRQRENRLGTHLPIIAMTAHALDRDRERCLAAGMDAYLSKPIQTDKLFEVIEGMIAHPAL